MNYVSAVYAVVGMIVAVDWFTRGRRDYGHNEEKRQSIVEDVMERRASVGSMQSNGVGRKDMRPVV